MALICRGCSAPIADAVRSTRTWCTEACRARAVRREAAAVRRATRPTLGQCAGCGSPFRLVPGHPARFCGNRCRSRTQYGLGRLLALGRAALGEASGERRERALRCGSCRASIGFAVVAQQTLVLERRVVVQLVGPGRLQVSAVCDGCGTLQRVAGVRVPAAASPEPTRLPVRVPRLAAVGG